MSTDLSQNIQPHSMARDPPNSENCTKRSRPPDPLVCQDHLVSNPLLDCSRLHVPPQENSSSEDVNPDLSLACHSDAEVKIKPSHSIQNYRFVSITPDSSKFCVYDATSVSTRPSFPMNSLENMPISASKPHARLVDQNMVSTPFLTCSNGQPSNSLHADDRYQLSSPPSRLSLTRKVGAILQNVHCVDDLLVNYCQSSVHRDTLPNPTKCHDAIFNTSSVDSEQAHGMTRKMANSLEDHLDISTLIGNDCYATVDYSSEQNIPATPLSVTNHLKCTTPCQIVFPEHSKRLQGYHPTNTLSTGVVSSNPSLPNIAGIRYYGQGVKLREFPSAHNLKNNTSGNYLSCSMKVGSKVTALKYPIAGYSNYFQAEDPLEHHVETECPCEHSVETVIFPEVSQAVVSQPGASTKVNYLRLQ